MAFMSAYLTIYGTLDYFESGHVHSRFRKNCCVLLHKAGFKRFYMLYNSLIFCLISSDKYSRLEEIKARNAIINQSSIHRMSNMLIPNQICFSKSC